MEQNYSIHNKLHDSNNGQWSNAAVAQYDDYWAAVAKYGSEVARLANVQAYDFVLVYMSDTYGNVKESIFRDSRVAPEPGPEPEPEPNESEE